MLEKDDKIGDYTLIKFLGRGQFGEVWLAEKQLQFSTRKFRHALKFLSNRGDEIDLKAAEAEIDTWMEASGHPNVMPVLDMIVFRDYVIIVSEYADGGSLGDWFSKNGGKSPSIDKAIEMMLGILRGIEHLHSRSVIHRDLKPDNILLQGNFPRITDFGISRIISDNTTATKAIGSPRYMSPEAFLGNKLPQTDIWSAGVILYEMLSGYFPFDGETIFGLRDAIMQSEPRPLPEDIPNDLGAIITNALQKDGAKRFQTAREMRLAVEKSLYRLRANATNDDFADQDDEPLVLTKPLVQFTDTPPQSPNEISENVPEKEFDQLTTQSEVEVILKTQPSPIDETRDAEELLREKQRQRESELAEISQETDKNRAKHYAAQRKKKFLTAGAVGGGILGLLLIVFLLVSMTGNNSTQTGTNSVKTISNNTPIDEKTKEIPASNTQASNKPTAPQGMAYVAGGEFMMGRDDGKSEAEKPAHKVSVQPFFMDVYETTNEQYAEFIKATKHKPPTEWQNGNYPNGQAKFPVVGVDWNDANDYAKWANKRLPTEEEWEYAARGANNFIYPWGNEWKQGKANVGTQSFAEVGKYKGASPFGIYDMVGNAWEWTSSDFKAYPNGKITEGANLKTIRGGSFEATKDFATTTYRIGYAATGANSYSRTGFHCVADVK